MPTPPAGAFLGPGGITWSFPSAVENASTRLFFADRAPAPIERRLELESTGRCQPGHVTVPCAQRT